MQCVQVCTSDRCVAALSDFVVAAVAHVLLADAAPPVHPSFIARCRGAELDIVSGKVSSEVVVLLFIQAAHVTRLLRPAANA
jgi:hypothetical protein